MPTDFFGQGSKACRECARDLRLADKPEGKFEIKDFNNLDLDIRAQEAITFLREKLKHASCLDCQSKEDLSWFKKSGEPLDAFNLADNLGYTRNFLQTKILPHCRVYCSTHKPAVVERECADLEKKFRIRAFATKDAWKRKRYLMLALREAKKKKQLDK